MECPLNKPLFKKTDCAPFKNGKSRALALRNSRMKLFLETSSRSTGKMVVHNNKEPLQDYLHDNLAGVPVAKFCSAPCF
jgi:hypothetical protein